MAHLWTETLRRAREIGDRGDVYASALGMIGLLRNYYHNCPCANAIARYEATERCERCKQFAEMVETQSRDHIGKGVFDNMESQRKALKDVNTESEASLLLTCPDWESLSLQQQTELWQWFEDVVFEKFGRSPSMSSIRDGVWRKEYKFPALSKLTQG